jgi:hypothetical protein
MTGAYLYDLFIHRDDILSIIHHCMGPALLLWIRASFSSFDSSDSLICRPLMMFVFFGAGIAGTASSSAVFLLRIGKNYMPSERLYRYFAPCLAALTISTVLSCYLNTWYLLHAYQGLYGHFGIAYIGPVTWEGFECYLQWRWLFRFHQLEKRFEEYSLSPGRPGIDVSFLDGADFEISHGWLVAYSDSGSLETGLLNLSGQCGVVC